METSLTIRLSKKQRAVLRHRAVAEKKSESAIVRDMIERETKSGFDYDRVRHLIGSVRIDRGKMRKDAWAEHIRQRNWRQ